MDYQAIIGDWPLMDNFNETYTDTATALPADLPPHIIRLARAIATECAAAGTYEITYTVPKLRVLPVSLEVRKSERIRDWEFER